MRQIFVPEIATVGSFSPLATVAELAEETGMYSASPDFVREHGGKYTVEILDAIPLSFYEECEAHGMYPNIDVRIHRLYPGDYPAVPGWHSDGEFRENYHAQPDLQKFTDHKHLIGTVSTDPLGVSNTEVVNEEIAVDIKNPSADNTLWEQVHLQVENSPVSKIQLDDGQLAEMGAFTLHRATPARTRGWRLFVRASMWHKPYLSEAGGSISHQEQVYRVTESKGW